jgi:hypothetical protein
VAGIKGQRIGGRQKGTPNKNGGELRAIAQKYTKEAIDLLAATMRRGEMPFALTAANSLLDRGHGKPAQAITGADGGDLVVQVVTGVSRDGNR